MEPHIKNIKSEPQRPVLSVNTPIHDFNDIKKGSVHSFDFILKNESHKEITIINARASCGCTSPTYEKDKVLAPGETTIVTANYTASHAEGKFSKHVTVFFNWQIIESNKALTQQQKDLTKQMLKLEIKGNIL